MMENECIENIWKRQASKQISLAPKGRCLLVAGKQNTKLCKKFSIARNTNTLLSGWRGIFLITVRNQILPTGTWIHGTGMEEQTKITGPGQGRQSAKIFWGVNWLLLDISMSESQGAWPRKMPRIQPGVRWKGYERLRRIGGVPA